MEQRIYFRSLFSDDHIARWTNREFTSFHHSELPAEWSGALANGKTNCEDYPLNTSNGFYLPSARDAFVEHCVEKGVLWERLDPKTKKVTTELSGVCAYDNPRGAYWYGGVRPQPDTRLVAFYGVELRKLESEKNGGVIAEVVQPIGGLMTPDEFVAEWCDKSEPMRPEGLPEDVNKEADMFSEGVVENGEMPDIRAKKGDSGGSLTSLVRDDDPEGGI